MNFFLNAFDDRLDSMVSIVFQPKNSESSQILWQRGRFHVDKWESHSITMNILMPGILRIQSNLATFSLSSLTIQTGGCKRGNKCTFEPGEECFLTSGIGQIVEARSTLIDLPRVDATTQSGIGHYLTIVSSQGRPSINKWNGPQLEEGTDYCLEFAIFKKFEQSEELFFVLVTKNVADGKEKEIKLWNSKQLFTNDGLIWHRVRETIRPTESGVLRLIIIQSSNLNTKNPIAIDDIMIRTGQCVDSSGCMFYEDDCLMELDPTVAENLFNKKENRKAQTHGWLVGSGRIALPNTVDLFVKVFDNELLLKSMTYADFTSPDMFKNGYSIGQSLRWATKFYPEVYDGCFTFTYLIINKSTNKFHFKLQLESPTASQLLWHNDHKESDMKWKTMSISVTHSGFFRFLFEASHDGKSSQVPFVAIQSYNLDSSMSCHQDGGDLDDELKEEQLEVSCQFDDEMCGWTEVGTQAFQFKKNYPNEHVAVYADPNKGKKSNSSNKK